MAAGTPAGAPACAPPGTVLGSRGRESPRGSSEDEPPQARRRVLPPAVLGRRQRPPRVGSSSDDEPPRRRPPPRAGSSLPDSSRDSNPHHPQGYAGGGAGGGGRGSATAAVPATGDQPQWLWPHISWGAVVAGTPAGCVVSHNFTAPPPPSNCGRVPRRGRGAGTGARKPCGRFWLHLGRAH